MLSRASLLRRLPRTFTTAAGSMAAGDNHANGVGLLAIAALAAAGVTGAGWNEKAECTAIAAVVGKDNFDAR